MDRLAGGEVLNRQHRSLIVCGFAVHIINEKTKMPVCGTIMMCMYSPFCTVGSVSWNQR